MINDYRGHRIKALMAGDRISARFYEQAAMRWAEVKQNIPLNSKEEKKKGFLYSKVDKAKL